MGQTGSGYLSVLAVSHQRPKSFGADINRPESFSRTPDTHLQTREHEFSVVGVVGVCENVCGGLVGVEVSGGGG